MSLKISQLPEFSGSPDATWIVLNNSGETTTSKILREDFLTGYTSPFQAGDFAKTYVNDYTATNAVAGTYQGIIGGSGNTITEASSFNLMIANSKDSSISDLSTNATYGGHGLILNSRSSNIASTGAGSGNHQIIGSQESTISDDGQQNQILGAFDGDITGGGSWNTIISGDGNKVNATGSFNPGYSIIAGGYANVMNGGGVGNAILAGNSNSITNSGPNAIIEGSSCSISNSNYNSTILGATAAQINNAGHSIVLGGYANILGSANCAVVSGRGNQYTGNYQDCEGGIYSSQESISYTAGKATMMGAGYQNTLSTASHYSVLLGGNNNVMDSTESGFMAGNEYCRIDTVDHMVGMILSSGSTISGSTTGVNNALMAACYNTKYHASGTQPRNMVFLGLSDRDIVLNDADRPFNPSGTTFVENIHAYRTLTRQTLTGITATGSVQVDLGNQTFMEFTITGNITDITFTNWREGGVYEFFVYNSGSYTITASGVRLNGIANTIFAKGGTLNPTNNGYSYYRLSIINSKGWLDEHLNYQLL